MRDSTLADLTPERRALLAGIDEIAWHELKHAYGPANDVPNLLFMLLVDDERLREDAWEQLYTNVWHQGTVYEASAYVVPFLLKMLAAEEPPGKTELLAFLTCLADGTSYLEVHATPDSFGEKVREWVEKEGRDFEAELKRELAWVEAANLAVGEGLALYLQLLAESDSEVWQRSLEVLTSLRGRDKEVISGLRNALEASQEAEKKAAIGEALAEFDDAGGNEA